jgi:hypothetical protein
MSNLVLAAPTLTIGLPLTAANGVYAQGATEAGNLATGSSTGFTFPNTPAGLVIVRFVTGSGGTGSLQFIATVGANPAAITVANSTTYLFGPFDPAVYSSVAGIVTATISNYTVNSVGVYILPASVPVAGFRATHNPLELVPGATDW